VGTRLTAGRDGCGEDVEDGRARRLRRERTVATNGKQQERTVAAGGKQRRRV
jgi:hypothetical protein